MIGILANQKGGVAKTINTLHLGSALAQKGYKILLIDLDPQCDLTHSVGIKSNDFFNVVDFIEDKPNLNFREKADNFYILPGSDDFISNKYKRTALKDALYKEFPNGQSINDHFDFIFIDCPPSKINIENSNKKFEFSEIELALSASDFFMIPLKADDFSVKNADKFLGKVSSFIKNYKLNINFLGFFFGCILNTENSKEYYTQIFNNSNLLFKAYIRQDAQVKKAVQKGLTIFQHNPNCRSANDYIALTDEFLTRLKHE